MTTYTALREALERLDSFRGDLESAAFEDANRSFALHASQADPSLLADLDRQAAEIARLREALKRIVDWDASGLALTEDHIAQACAALEQSK